MRIVICFTLILISAVRSSDTVGLRGRRALANHETRIIGGNDALPDRYPYFAMMWGSSLCGGALIAPDIVVTAAHCSNAADEVIVGRHTRKSWNDNSETIGIEMKILYPEYRSTSFAYDVMLLKLESTSTKPYVKLRSEPPHDADELTVIGFGDTVKGSALIIPTELQEVQLDFISNEECGAMHGNNAISDDMLCAARKDKDSCNGDSGGPLFIKHEEHVDDELVGTVAWGRGCADERYPGVYSRISYFYDWIVDRICEHSVSPPDEFNCGERLETVDYVEDSTTESPSVLPSDIPSNFPSQTPTQLLVHDKLTFLGWNPSIQIEHCEGDCDRDDDCIGDMICFQRSGATGVPGCQTDEGVPAIADFCIFETDLSK